MEPAAFVLVRNNSNSSTYRFLQYTDDGTIKETHLVVEILHAALKSSLVYATISEAQVQGRLPDNLVYNDGGTIWGVWQNDRFIPQPALKDAFDAYIKAKYVM